MHFGMFKTGVVKMDTAVETTEVFVITEYNIQILDIKECPGHEHVSLEWSPVVRGLDVVSYN